MFRISFSSLGRGPNKSSYKNLLQMNTDSFYQLNNSIYENLASSEPSSVIRLGHTETSVLIDLIENKTVTDGLKYWLEINAGVFPSDEKFLKEIFISTYLHTIENSDIVGFVSSTHEQYFLRNKNTLKKTFSGNQITVLNPLILLKKLIDKEISRAWTSQFNNKTILFITPFVNTFTTQALKLDKIWGKYRDIILPSENIRLLKAPFSPKVQGFNMVDSFGSPCSTWRDNLNAMCQAIAALDFDLAVIGAGAYAPPLASFIKQIGKKAITTCGDTQLFFGILGERWKPSSTWWRGTNIEELITPEWLDGPIANDLPQNKFLNEQLERAYW